MKTTPEIITSFLFFRMLLRNRRVAAVAEWYRYRIVACLVTSSSPVPLKTRRVGQLCTLNLSRAETSSRWCGVVVRRGGASSGVVHVTGPWFKITWSVAKSPCAAEQCDVNIQSIIPIILMLLLKDLNSYGPYHFYSGFFNPARLR
ncbi:uncharacterized protein TNCV_888441 [Trichonephila clavipes]|nr:uncharacterized protein TNCV_888441 [Trichonephila clavipes]